MCGSPAYETLVVDVYKSSVTALRPYDSPSSSVLCADLTNLCCTVVEVVSDCIDLAVPKEALTDERHWLLTDACIRCTAC
jgi:hypothetical protein